MLTSYLIKSVDTHEKQKTLSNLLWFGGGVTAGAVLYYVVRRFRKTTGENLSVPDKSCPLIADEAIDEGPATSSNVANNIEQQSSINKDLDYEKQNNSNIKHINAHHLDEYLHSINKIIDEIRKGEKGIGMILLENKVENYRRIMEIGYNSRDSFIYRKYVLLSRKHIISKIVENFSRGVYK